MRAATTLILSLTFVVPSTTQAADRHVTREIEVQGLQRTYHYLSPAGHRGPHPVVLVFHGGGSNAAATIRYTKLDQLAAREGFVTVYPEGTGRLARILTWNTGFCCGHAEREGIDDVAFVRALVSDLQGQVDVDPRRIYVTGISNGGMMAYRLACEAPDLIAAIAPVAGTIALETCAPGRPVPVMHFHGTEDLFVDYEGGPGPRSHTQSPFTSVEATMAGWVGRNGCREEPTRTTVVAPAGDALWVTRDHWSGCAQDADVLLYTIQGGGHTWPGIPARFRRLGPSTEDISANELMWEFFREHPIPEHWYRSQAR